MNSTTCDTTRLEQILFRINPADLNNEEWVELGMALKAEGGDFETFDRWSAQDLRPGHGYPGRENCLKRWESFRSEGVKGGTIVHKARELGVYQSAMQGYALSFDDAIDLSKADDFQPAAEAPWNPVDDMVRYLEAVFRPGEHPCFVVKSEEEDGHFRPSESGSSRYTREEVCERLKACDGDIGAVIGDYNEAAGGWVAVNPMDGRRSRANVEAFRNALVESDTLPEFEQIRLYRQLKLPIAAITESGGKSVHAVVRVDAPDAAEYAKRVNFLFSTLEQYGFEVDQQNKDPSRLTRLAGLVRGARKQKLLDTDTGCNGWDEWVEHIKEQNDGFPAEAALDMQVELPEREVVIEGLALKGELGMVTGSSKSGKTTALMELALAHCVGGEWMGHRCKQGKILYCDFELRPEEFARRVREISSRLGYDFILVQRNFVYWNMQGAVTDDNYADILDAIIRRIRRGDYVQSIIDPMYVLNPGDENSAQDMTRLFNKLWRICHEGGKSVVVAHHHSKGAQSGKAVLDRNSGSGVIGRSVSWMLDMIAIRMPHERRTDIEEWLGLEGDEYESIAAVEINSICRYFAAPKPVRMFFKYPVHIPDETGLLDKAKYSDDTTFDPEPKDENGRTPKEQEYFDILMQCYADLDGMPDKYVPVRDLRSEFMKRTHLGDVSARKYIKKFGFSSDSIGGVQQYRYTG